MFRPAVVTGAGTPRTSGPAEVAGLLAVGAPYRGMAWARRPEVEALIRRRAAHRRAWLWAVYGALIVFGCMTVLSIGLLFTSDGPPVVRIPAEPDCASASVYTVVDVTLGCQRSPGPVRRTMWKGHGTPMSAVVQDGSMATVLAFHAHPDDEVLLTGGTLARVAAHGHRVVIVVATDGLMDAAPQGEAPRLGELRASAAVLGVARVVHLGYANSGHGAILCPDPPDRARFVRADTEEAAERLAAVLREECAELLLSYDANGGYGHRDHVKVHEVGKRAAELARVPRVLEATMPRDVVDRLTKLVRLLRIPFRFDADALRTAYSPRAAITHTIDVRGFAGQKQAALAAHRSEVSGTGRLAPVMRMLVRLPAPVFGWLLGTEWFVEAGATTTGKTVGDIFQQTS